jgi:hypothetical protein
MKTRVLVTTMLSVVALAAAPASLTAADPAPGSPAALSAPPAEFIDPEAPEVAEIRAVGERAINRLAMTLVNEVSNAVAKGGVEGAVEVCHLKALPLTGEIIAGMPRITAVKRTSLRLRNPANAPDSADTLALQRVEKEIEAGKPPKLVVQRLDLDGGKREWRVYRPLGLLPQCVECHGPREQQPAALRAKLEQLYPNDQAVGYLAGHWRGLIRVSVSDPPPPPPPKPAAPAAAPKSAPGKPSRKT